MRDRSYKLYETYLAPHSEKELNITCQLQTKLTNFFKSQQENNTIQSGIFDEVQAQVFADITIGEFERFLHSNLYKDTLHRSVPLETIKTWAIDFDGMRTHQVGVEVFQNFLKEEISLENWQFWQAILAYKALNLPKEQMRLRAQAIVHKFLTSGSEYECPIDYDIRQNINKTLESGPTADMFEHAEAEVFKTLRDDAFPRFGSSTAFVDFVSKVKQLKKMNLLQ